MHSAAGYSPADLIGRHETTVLQKRIASHRKFLAALVFPVSAQRHSKYAYCHALARMKEILRSDMSLRYQSAPAPAPEKRPKKSTLCGDSLTQFPESRPRRPVDFARYYISWSRADRRNAAPCALFALSLLRKNRANETGLQRKAGNGQRRTDQAPFWQLPRHALESRIPDVKPRAGAKSGPGLLPFFISLPCAPYPLFFFYQPCRARPTPVCEIRVFRHHPPRGRLFEGERKCRHGQRSRLREGRGGTGC